MQWFIKYQWRKLFTSCKPIANPFITLGRNIRFTGNTCVWRTDRCTCKVEFCSTTANNQDTNELNSSLNTLSKHNYSTNSVLVSTWMDGHADSSDKRGQTVRVLFLPFWLHKNHENFYENIKKELNNLKYFIFSL